jgi:hypothetical protein
LIISLQQVYYYADEGKVHNSPFANPIPNGIYDMVKAAKSEGKYLPLYGDPEYYTISDFDRLIRLYEYFNPGGDVVVIPFRPTIVLYEAGK